MFRTVDSVAVVWGTVVYYIHKRHKSLSSVIFRLRLFCLMLRDTSVQHLCVPVLLTCSRHNKALYFLSYLVLRCVRTTGLLFFFLIDLHSWSAANASGLNKWNFKVHVQTKKETIRASRECVIDRLIGQYFLHSRKNGLWWSKMKDTRDILP